MTSQTPADAAHRPMSRISSGVQTDPVGFDGDTKTSAFVAGVRAASKWSMVTVAVCGRRGQSHDGPAGEGDLLSC